jgi:hypothetical protein
VFLTSITITTIKEPAEPQEYWEIIGYAYELGQTGATFDPPVTLTIEYDSTLIPYGISEDNLFIAHWDEDTLEWVETYSTVNTGENLVSTRINHFSVYAVMAKTRPAEFSIADLSVVPGGVDPGEVVTISVTVANTGDLTASYEAVLKINNTVQETKDITLGGNDSQKVSFTVTPDTGGEYTVDVNGLPGGFTVRAPEGEVAEIPAPEKPAPAPAEPTPPAKEPVTPPPEMEAPVQEIPEEPTTNWGMWGGIIAAVIVIGGLLTYFLWYRRRTAY